MSIISLLGPASLYMLRAPIPTEDISNPEDKSIAHVSNDEETQNEESIEIDSLSKNTFIDQEGITLYSTLKLLKTSKMIKFLCLVLYSAILSGFYGGLLVKLVSNVVEAKDDKLIYSLYCLFALG
mmetsp:Transcript_10241/g.11672  ORF Transcript_10241/g.11672 Transcript_10241/m.11672 type:complete len:125 (+) Transcript_10241:769-1143(+)